MSNDPDDQPGDGDATPDSLNDQETVVGEDQGTDHPPDDFGQPSSGQGQAGGQGQPGQGQPGGQGGQDQPDQGRQGQPGQGRQGQPGQGQPQGQPDRGQPGGRNRAGGQDPSGGQGGQGQPGQGQPGGQGGQGQSRGQPGQGGQGQPGGQPQGQQGQGGYNQAQPQGQQAQGAQGGYNQPQQQAQQGGAYQQPPATRQGGSSGTGLEPNVAATVAYFFGWLGGLVMLLIEDDEFVTFHAKQSIAFSVVIFGAYVAVALFQVMLGLIPRIGGLLSFFMTFLYPLIGLVAFAGWVWLMYQAYQGEWFKLPVIGNLVANN